MNQSNKKLVNIVVCFGFVILLVGGWFGGRYVMKLSQSEGTISLSEVTKLWRKDESVGGTDVSEIDNWKTYTNSTYNYELKYPSNWELDDSTADRTEGSDFASVSVNRGEYKFQLNVWLKGRSTGICVFPDSAGEGELRVAGPIYLQLSDYAELTQNGEVFRRNNIRLPQDSDMSLNGASFVICSVDQDYTDTYCEFCDGKDVWTYFNKVGNEVVYYTPDMPTQEQMEVLDNIFLSVKVLE